MMRPPIPPNISLKKDGLHDEGIGTTKTPEMRKNRNLRVGFRYLQVLCVTHSGYKSINITCADCSSKQSMQNFFLRSVEGRVRTDQTQELLSRPARVHRLRPGCPLNLFSLDR